MVYLKLKNKMSAPNFQISAGKDGKTANKVADVDDIAKPFVNFPGFGGGVLHLQSQGKAPGLGDKMF